jgi:hypothetical protein
LARRVSNDCSIFAFWAARSSRFDVRKPTALVIAAGEPGTPGGALVGGVWPPDGALQAQHLLGVRGRLELGVGLTRLVLPVGAVAALRPRGLGVAFAHCCNLETDDRIRRSAGAATEASIRGSAHTPVR